ncbi:MAG: hypothetical protein Q7T11_01365, partial [Deltaproteobacteria bacterium]|nr:hypothetical protein [Deltaproteobacteria bacterium]
MKNFSLILSFLGGKQAATLDHQAASDAELMIAYKNGDAAAFNVLLARHQGGIYNFLYRYLGNN